MPYLTRTRETVNYTYPSLEDDSQNWRRLTSSDFSLPEYDITRMHDVSLFLYRFNPIGHRIATLIRDYTVGAGISVIARDKEVQGILDKFNKAQYPSLNAIARQISVELSVFGEITLPAGVNEVNGDVILDYVPPQNVKDVTLRKSTMIGHETVSFVDDNNPLPVVHIETDPRATIDVNGTQHPAFGYLVGSCFYFSVNRLAQESRGLSDMLPIADFADLHDQMLFNSLERLNHEMAWWWDVEMKGSSPDEIQDKANELSKSPPKPGSFNVHNEYVTWTPVKSGVTGSSVREIAAIIRNYALGGVGIATHFFTEPESGGRAIGEAMAAPTFQMMLTRQEEIRDAIGLIYKFVIDQKRLRGVLPKDTDTSFEILMPKISIRDFQRTGGAFYRIVQAIDLGVSKKFIHQEDAAKVFYALIQQLGMGLETVRGLAEAFNGTPSDDSGSELSVAGGDGGEARPQVHPGE